MTSHEWHFVPFSKAGSFETFICRKCSCKVRIQVRSIGLEAQLKENYAAYERHKTMGDFSTPEDCDVAKMVKLHGG